MTTQHTPERLRVATDGSLASIETESGKPIGQTFQTKPIKTAADHEERIANAHRLVACWNACEGISTDALETERSAAMGWMRCASKLIHAKAQRDDLLAECKATLEELCHLADGDQCTLIRLKRAVEKAEVFAS